jgi:hypothetical protein
MLSRNDCDRQLTIRTQRNRLKLGEWMIGGHERQKWNVDGARLDDDGPGGRGESADEGIQNGGDEHLVSLRLVRPRHRQLDLRMVLRIRGNLSHNVVEAEVDADAQRMLGDACRLSCGPLGLLGCENRRSRRREHCSTTRGQLYRATIARVQRGAHQLFKTTDLLRERWLSEVQAVSSPAEMQLFRQHHKDCSKRGSRGIANSIARTEPDRVPRNLTCPAETQRLELPGELERDGRRVTEFAMQALVVVSADPPRRARAGRAGRAGASDDWQSCRGLRLCLAIILVPPNVDA